MSVDVKQILGLSNDQFASAVRDLDAKITSAMTKGTKEYLVDRKHEIINSARKGQLKAYILSTGRRSVRAVA